MVLALLSGLLLALAFPEPAWHELAWIGLVPLGIAISRAPSARRAALYGLAGGTLFYGIVLRWIAATAQWVGPPGQLGWAALAIYQGLFIGLFALFVWVTSRSEAGRTPLGQILLFAASLTAAEWIRNLGPWGMTAGNVAYSQVGNLPLIQLSRWTGLWGVTFLIGLTNAMIIEWIRSTGDNPYPWRRLLGHTAGVAAVIVMVLTLGQLTMMKAASPTPRFVRAALIQANIPQYQKLNPSAAKEIYRTHMVMTRAIARDACDFVAWPETSFPDVLDNFPTLTDEIGRLAYNKNMTIMVGQLRGTASLAAPYRFYNNLTAFGPTGQITGSYDKVHLVPFGEYLPLRPIVGPLLRGVSLLGLDLSAGMAAEPLRLGTIEAGAMICFESTLPRIARERVRRGAEFLLVATNDAWFGDSPAAKIHFLMAPFRAVETGRDIIQVANTGISGIIDAHGQIKTQTELNHPSVVIGPVELRSHRTPYVLWGDIFPMGCVLAVLAGFVLRRK